MCSRHGRLQPLVFAAQPIAVALQIGALTFDASQLLAHANEVATGAHQFVAHCVIGWCGTVGTIGHAPFLPAPDISYMHGILDRSMTMR
jgi:hypothetical protein